MLAHGEFVKREKVKKEYKKLVGGDDEVGWLCWR